MLARATLLTLCLLLTRAAAPVLAQTVNPDAGYVGDDSDETPAALTERSWQELESAIAPKRNTDTRIAALNALSLLGGQARAEKLVGNAIADANVDVRLAAIVAAGEMTGTRASHSAFFPELRHLLDDPDPKIAFTAASTLWKLHDPSGEDIMIAVAEGERSADYSFWKGSRHNASRTLHNPSALAKIGATQGMLFLVPPVGIGMGAYAYLKGSGGPSPQITAIAQLTPQPSGAVQQALIAATKDKDPGARIAAAEALASLHGPAIRDALRPLLDDNKEQVRFTASAAYIRVNSNTLGNAAAKPTSTRHPRRAHPEP